MLVASSVLSLTYFKRLWPFRGASLPEIYVIGDSISLGYTPFLQKALKGHFEVRHNPGNARYTQNTIDHLEKWIRDAEGASFIIWNNGLHDLSQADLGRPRTGPEEYRSNLILIGRRLKKLKIPIVMVTTTHTPAIPAEPNRQERTEKYNQIMRSVAFELGLRVIDLGTYSGGFTQHHIKPETGDVHWTKRGYEIFANFIVFSLEQSGLLEAEPEGKEQDGT